MISLFVTVIIIFSIIIFWINKGRNAWDVLFFNSTLAIVTLFFVGILANNIDVWKIIAGGLVVVATGEKVVALFVKNKSKNQQ